MVDPALHRDVHAFVDEGIRDMPTHLRAGVASVAGLMLLGSMARRARPFDRLSPSERRAAVHGWQQSRLAPVRQYMRLLRSLVLYAAYERPSAIDAS